MYSDPSNQPSPAAPELRPRNGKATEGSSASSSSSSPSTSDIPPPTSDIGITDAVLLARVAARDTDPEDLAEELGIKLDLLLDWMRAPQTVARVNTLVEARELNRQRIRDLKRDRLLDELEQLHDRAKADGDPVEQRRAATVFLRFARATPRATDIRRASGVVGASSHDLTLSRLPAHYRTRSRRIRAVPILHEPPTILPPPEQPDPSLAPAGITLRILHRLQDSDNPREGDGLRTLFNHFTDAMRKDVEAKTADDFAYTPYTAYHHLLAHHSAVLFPTEFDPAADESDPQRTAEQSVHLIDLDGRAWMLTLGFTRASEDKPWLIDHVNLDKPPTAAAAEAPEPETS